VGTLGPAIFSDDLAVDIRDEWRALIGDGLTPAAATEAILTSAAPELADPGTKSTVWIALAMAQWSTGRLVDTVRDMAVAIIDSGGDLQRWDAGPRRAAREKALARAREQLLSPQPEAKKIPKRRLSQTPFAPGDVISYEHGPGERLLFWVMRNKSDNGGEYSRMEVLDSVGAAVPDTRDAVRLPALAVERPPLPDGRPRDPDRVGITLVNGQRIPAHRYIVIGNEPHPAQRPRCTLNIVAADKLDAWLTALLPRRVSQ
jgi:hypothetical protein